MSYLLPVEVFIALRRRFLLLVELRQVSEKGPLALALPSNDPLSER
jgi:hypothetical protein